MPLSLEEQIDISVAQKGQRQEVWAQCLCYFHGQNYPYNNTVYLNGIIKEQIYLLATKPIVLILKFLFLMLPVPAVSV